MPEAGSMLPAPGGADVVVVGAGVAGLSAALALPHRRVLLVTKRRLGEGGASPWAQGGVAVALGPGDSPQRHAEDTMAVAAGIADRAAVALLTTRGPERIEALRALGARFDVGPGGELAFGREAAHSASRILHAGGDATGAEMVRALTEAVRRAPWIEVVEESFAEDLVVEGGRVVGVVLRDPAGAPRLLAAGAVVLATGGIGQVYRYTTNPPEATGDGLAMAARAGARLADLEFVQFHPTALASGRDPLPLLTEALRGEGAVLIDGAGRRFMTAEHPLAELAPRDVVARAIWRRREAGDGVFLDARAAVGDRFPSRFPTVFERCREQGFDPRVDPLPVTPAAHYHMGGVAVDLAGRTSLSGLWACGEVACTGAHGGNRLASNSLLEALVFGAGVGDDIEAQDPARPDARSLWRNPVWLAGRRLAPAQPAAGEPLRSRVRELAWRRIGVVRDASGLSAALDELDRLATGGPAPAGESRNLLEVARLVAEAALLRRESRGAHWRSDYPATDPAAARRTLATAPELELAVLAARPRTAAGTRA